MQQKYLLIFKFGQMEMAQVFDEGEQATAKVNTTIKNNPDIIRELVDVDTNHWHLNLRSSANQYVDIKIKSYDADSIKFYLDYSKNDQHIETRCFSRRDYAIKYVHKAMRELHKHRCRYNEDCKGLWKSHAHKNNPKANMILFVTVVDKITQKHDSVNDYKTLEIPEDASEADAKKAYRRLSKLYHPDMPNGDIAKFQAIEEAYRRIKDKKGKKGAKKERPKVRENYFCYNFDYFMSELSNSAYKSVQRYELRQAMIGLAQIVLGLIALLVALLIYNN